MGTRFVSECGWGEVSRSVCVGLRYCCVMPPCCFHIYINVPVSVVNFKVFVRGLTHVWRNGDLFDVNQNAFGDNAALVADSEENLYSWMSLGDKWKKHGNLVSWILWDKLWNKWMNVKKRWMNVEMSGWMLKWVDECWNEWMNVKKGGWMLIWWEEC